MARLCENRWAMARLCENRSAMARLCENRWAMARLCENRWAMARLCENRSAMARLCENRWAMAGLCENRWAMARLCENRWAMARLCENRWAMARLCENRCAMARLCENRWAMVAGSWTRGGGGYKIHTKYFFHEFFCKNFTNHPSASFAPSPTPHTHTVHYWIYDFGEMLYHMQELLLGTYFFSLRPSRSLRLSTGTHQRHSPETICCEVHIPLLCQPDLAPRNGLTVPCFHPQ